MKTLSEKLQQQRNKEIEQISAAAIKAGKSNANATSLMTRWMVAH